MEEEIKIRKKEKKSLKAREAWEKKKQSDSIKSQSEQKESATVRITDQTTVEKKKLISEPLDQMETQDQHLSMQVLTHSATMIQGGRDSIEML